MNGPLDDDLYLYSSNKKINNGTKESVKIWEFYEIHPSKPRKILPYGSWRPNEGLNLSKDEKWVRRRNLEVIFQKSLFQNYITLEEKRLCDLDIIQIPNEGDRVLC